jgi:hypothetical protein
MVLALLAGRKTQTRRIVKPQPGEGEAAPWARVVEETKHPKPTFREHAESVIAAAIRKGWKPYAVPGDRLWGREAWGLVHEHHTTVDKATALEDAKAQKPWAGIAYRATPNGGFAESHLVGDCWRPSIFMPRFASRLLHEVAAVRVERLLDITEADAIAEGILPEHGPMGVTGWSWPGSEVVWSSARDCYLGGWDSINGEGEAKKNPWVWVVEFKPAVTAC